MEKKLDLFEVLGRLDKRDFALRDSHLESPDKQKELDKNAGWLYPQWFTCTSDTKEHRRLVEQFNTQCNPDWFALYKHPELQLKLMAAIGSGRVQRHKFAKPKTPVRADLLEELLTTVYPDIRKDEVNLWCRLNTEADLHTLAARMGKQPEEIEKLLEQYAKR